VEERLGFLIGKIVDFSNHAQLLRDISRVPAATTWQMTANRVDGKKANEKI